VVERCYITGDLIGEKDGGNTSDMYLGGIAGVNSPEENYNLEVSIANCFTVGTVSVLVSTDPERGANGGNAIAGGITGT
jgi:hypothetical protein